MSSGNSQEFSTVFALQRFQGINQSYLYGCYDAGMNPKLQRLLVFRIGQFGDTVAALPSLWVLRQQFPTAHILVLSELPAKKTHMPPEAVLPQSGLVDGFVKYPGG